MYSASRGNTTPKKKRHSNHPHESRLSRIPFIGRRNSIGGAIGNGDNDAVGTLKCPRNIPVEEFDADVFRQLIEYCHTGCVTLNAETILGESIETFGLNTIIGKYFLYLFGTQISLKYERLKQNRTF